MLRMTMRALACAITTTFVLSAPAVAAADATPTITNVTTGAPSVYAGPDRSAVGDTLRGYDNDWAGIGVYNYQWHRCADGNGWVCDPLSGATASDYQTVADDYGMTLKFCATVPRGGTTCSTPSSIVFAKHEDTDADGTPDYSDACPTTAGPSNGCAAPAPAAAPSTDDSVAPTPSPAVNAPTTSTPASDATQPARGAANGAGAASGARVLIASRTRSRKVRYGKKALVIGRLRAPDGAPISGATLTVFVKRRVPGADFIETASAVTRSDGTFVYTAPAGPSRVIRVAYRAFAADTTFTDTTEVTLLVKGALSLKAPRKIRNGKAALFSGRLRGKPVPKSGVLVDLQVWFHKKWRTFATPRTNRHGAFKFKYRFTRGAATWKFRARIRKDSLYPYELAYSRNSKTRVTG